jgi:hypothetical protein
MVKLKKQIVTILIFSLFLSLILNFLYTKEREVFAEEEPCENVSCPSECPDSEPVYDEKTDSCSCINCQIPCKLGAKTFVNNSCLPLEETGEWVCGTEIPVGEVMDRTAYLAGRMLAEFGGIVESGREMATWSDRLLTDYKKWSCPGYTDWEDKEKKCETECYKYFYVAAGELRPGEDEQCPQEARYVPRGIYAGDECKENPAQCQSCADCGERCCWQEEYSPDPEKPEETIICKYCRKEGSDPETGEPYCQEMCTPYACRGCCSQYFSPIINGYSNIENLQEALENDVGETDSPEKLRRSYILEQLDFSRCELAQCWNPAEDYYDILTGEKVGKHLLTCEMVSRSGLFDDDQVFCSVSQAANEWEEVQELWEEMEKESWWQKPVVFFQTLGEIIKLGGGIIWEMVKEWFEIGQEEECYPTNYYCCQM